MNRAGLEQFNARRLEAQYALYGVTGLYDGQEVVVCMTSVRSSKELGDGGFKMTHDFMAKIQRAEVPEKPVLESELTMGDKKYRVVEVLDHPLSGEWKLGLAQIG